MNALPKTKTEVKTSHLRLVSNTRESQKVSVDDGFTQIPNELLFAMGKFGFTQRQFNLLIAVILKTLSWHKEMDWVSNSQICELVDLPDEQKASKTKQELVRMNVLIQKGNQIGFNLVVSEWRKDDCTKGANIAQNVQKKLHKSCNSDCTKGANTKETITKQKINNTPCIPQSDVLPKQKKSSVVKFNPENVDLPNYVDRDVWIAYCQMRKAKGDRYAIKTESTVKTCLNSLAKHCGGDPTLAMAVLEQSIENTWTGLFALKDFSVGGAKTSFSQTHTAVIDLYNRLNAEFGEVLTPAVESNPRRNKAIDELMANLKQPTLEFVERYFTLFFENMTDWHKSKKIGIDYLLKLETLTKVREGAL